MPEKAWAKLVPAAYLSAPLAQPDQCQPIAETAAHSRDIFVPVRFFTEYVLLLASDVLYPLAPSAWQKGELEPDIAISSHRRWSGFCVQFFDETKTKAIMKLFNKILCAVEFDESSPAVVHFAREIAKEYGATLCLLHVTPLPLNATEFSPIPMDPYPVWEKTARAELEKLAAAHLEGRGVTYKIETRSAEAADGILGQAQDMDADLIVLATHGRRGVSHFLIGSVAERVIRRSPRPVLVVRPREVAPGSN